jgi:hypothetical protein
VPQAVHAVHALPRGPGRDVPPVTRPTVDVHQGVDGLWAGGPDADPALTRLLRGSAGGGAVSADTDALYRTALQHAAGGLFGAGGQDSGSARDDYFLWDDVELDGVPARGVWATSPSRVSTPHMCTDTKAGGCAWSAAWWLGGKMGVGCRGLSGVGGLSGVLRRCLLCKHSRGCPPRPHWRPHWRRCRCRCWGEGWWGWCRPALVLSTALCQPNSVLLVLLLPPKPWSCVCVRACVCVSVCECVCVCVLAQWLFPRERSVVLGPQMWH